MVPPPPPLWECVASNVLIFVSSRKNTIFCVSFLKKLTGRLCMTRAFLKTSSLSLWPKLENRNQSCLLLLLMTFPLNSEHTFAAPLVVNQCAVQCCNFPQKQLELNFPLCITRHTKINGLLKTMQGGGLVV